MTVKVDEWMSEADKCQTHMNTEYDISTKDGKDVFKKANLKCLSILKDVYQKAEKTTKPKGFQKRQDCTTKQR